jgi:hypothetical protein
MNPPYHAESVAVAGHIALVLRITDNGFLRTLLQCWSLLPDGNATVWGQGHSLLAAYDSPEAPTSP